MRGAYSEPGESRGTGTGANGQEPAAEGNTHIPDRGKIWPNDQVLLPRELNGLLPVSEPQPSTDIKKQMVMQNKTVAGALPAQEMVPNFAADE